MPQNKIHFDNERTDAVNIGFEEEIISENNGSLNDNGKSLAATDLTDKTNLNGVSINFARKISVSFSLIFLFEQKNIMF